MKNTFPILAITLLLAACSFEQKMLRKASNAVDRSDFDGAISYYEKLIHKNENSFYGNAGKGIVLAEFQARHEQAIPYLEKALKNSPDKSKPIIHGNLGRSYHFIGNYKRALLYYDKLSTDNDPKYSDYDEFLAKRIADCRYAINHPRIAIPEHQSVRNIGRPVNTEHPEYTPVAVDNKLFFTSKRKDTPKEKKNQVDGRYFESIYVSNIGEDNSFSEPRLYKLPPASGRLKKYGEAVVSASPDGKTLYIYRGGKIYETSATDSAEKLKALGKNVNIAMQNHACLTPDGNTMYFSAEDSRNGRGGSDLYVTTRNDDGTWSDPRILPNNINTQYDEDSPFMSDQGILYFASNGHPGYGGYDMYKTRLVDNVWIAPENLGQPVNSPGDDIFFSLKENSPDGYYASARPGGVGDLDIYKVHYVLTEDVRCQQDSMFVINTEQDPENPLIYIVEIDVPDQYKNNVRSYRWDLNNKEIAETSEKFIHTFDKADSYTITSRLTVYCDTCPKLIGKCATYVINAGKPTLAATDSVNKLTRNKVAVNVKQKDKQISWKDYPDKKSEKPADKDNAIADNVKAEMDKANEQENSRTKGKKSRDNNARLAGEKLSDAKLRELNWNQKSLYFDYDDVSIRGKAKKILDENIAILKNNSDINITINGYADSRGEKSYNKYLSKKRAAQVKEYLVKNGISEDRIIAVRGYGESELVNHCNDNTECSEDEHQQNRRVVFVVTNGKGVSPVTSR